MNRRSRYRASLAGALLLLLISPVVSAQGLTWSAQLVPGTRPQVEVVVDTYGLAKNQVVDAASFEAAFSTATGGALGRRTFTVTDAKLFILEADNVYRRYYYSPFAAAKGLQPGNLNYTVRTLGDKADGGGDVVQVSGSKACCTPSQNAPSVEVRPETSAAVRSLTVHGSVNAVTARRAMVVAATRESQCAAYSRLAVAQSEANKRRGCYAPDNRWHSDFEHHNQWCLQAPPADVRAESTTRQQLLNQCNRPGP